MNLKKNVGIFLLVLSVLLLTYNHNSLTGAVIDVGKLKNYFWVFGLALLSVSIFMLNSKKSLDVIIIPTGNIEEDKIRTQKALEEYNLGHVDSFMISGQVEGQGGKRDLKNSQRYGIYKNLREENVRSSQIKISGGKDSRGNVFESFKKIGDAKNIGIVSYPKHLERFKKIIEEGVSRGYLPEDVNVEYIPTKQTTKEWIYGTLANVKEKYHLRNKGLNFLSRLVQKIIG